MSRRALALSALLGAALSAGLVACGGDDGRERSATATQTVTQRAQPTTTTPRLANEGAIEGEGTEGTPGSASTGTPGIAGGTGSVGAASIYRPFSPQSPWNTTVQGQAVDDDSDRLIRAAQERIGVTERGDFITTQRRRNDDPLFINTREWTVPIVDEEGGVPTRVVCRQIPPDCGDGKNVETLLIPPDESPRPEYDGWFTVLNRREGVAYDMWRARRGEGEANVFSYQFMRRWTLTGPGFQRPNSVSARGSGLPLFAGVLLPEEVRAGRIDHALAISVPGPAQRNYVQPASATDGNGRITSLPEGARIRLRPDRYDDLVSIATCPSDDLRDAEGQPRNDCIPPRTNRRAARAILEALRRYGAIVVDRSRTPTLYAKLNADWGAILRGPDGRVLRADGRTPLARSVARLDNQGTPLLRGNEVQFLRLSDFEVLRLGEVLKFPPLGDTPVANQTFTPVVP
jgi:hypothetical protein